MKLVKINQLKIVIFTAVKNRCMFRGRAFVMRLTVCSLCIMSVCKFGYFPFWFRAQCFVSDCISS